MNEPLARLVRDVMGTNDKIFVALLCRQVDVAREGARLLRAEAVSGETPDDLDEQLERIEHRGDTHRNDLIAELSAALTTPVDREDLHRLSRSIDDVLDNLRDFAVEMVMYGVRPAALLGPPLQAVLDGLNALRAAVEDVGRPASELPASSRAAKHANDVRRAYHAAIAELLDGELTMDTLRYREVLRRLDVAGLRLEEAADALADAALKRA